MKKIMKRMAALVLSVVTLTGSCMVVHGDGYTYGYDIGERVASIPDAYMTVAVPLVCCEFRDWIRN